MSAERPTRSQATEAAQMLMKEMKSLAGQALITKEQMEEFGLLFDQKAELKERLNIRLKGGNPGRPFNWRGEDGLR
jgi:hypothetical protein